MENYPDDIRQYDNDPRSPFYDDRKEVAIENRAEEISSDPSSMMEAIQGDEKKVFEFIKAMCAAFRNPIGLPRFEDAMRYAWVAWEDIALDCAKEEIENDRVIMKGWIESLPEQEKKHMYALAYDQMTYRKAYYGENITVEEALVKIRKNRGDKKNG